MDQVRYFLVSDIKMKKNVFKESHVIVMLRKKTFFDN